MVSQTGHSPARCFLEILPSSELLRRMWLLCRYPDRTIVGMAGPHGDAADGLHGGVGNRDCIGAQRQRLDEIRRLAQTAGDDERDIATLQAIKMAPRPSQCGNRRHGYVVAENNRRGASTAATAIKDDVVDADLRRGVDVFFNVPG